MRQIYAVAGAFDSLQSKMMYNTAIHVENGVFVDPAAGHVFRDFSSLYAIPGLIDCHAHLSFDVSHSEPVDRIAQTHQDILLRRALENAALALKAGVTTIRDLGDQGYVTNRLRNTTGCDIGGIPTILTSGPPLTIPGGHCHFLGGAVETEQDIRLAVEERAAESVDTVKVMVTGGILTNESDPEALQFNLDQLKFIVTQAKKHHLPVVAHAHSVVGIANALLSGVREIEHCTFLSRNSDPPPTNLLKQIATSGTYVCPTVVASQDIPQSQEFLAWRMSVLSRLLESGANVIPGTDAGVYRSLGSHRLPEAILTMQLAGASAASCLSAATIQAASACGVGQRKGRVRPGYDADFVLLDKDPVRDLRTILQPRFVVSRGVIQPDGA